MPSTTKTNMFCKHLHIFLWTLSLFLLAACGNESNNSVNFTEENKDIITDKTISGVSQKGPFVNGSSITIQELDKTSLAQTGNSFEGKIKNDLGEFSVKVEKLESQYAVLKANGFYRNEMTGEKSNSPVTLYALTDLNNRNEVNINLLTHLAYERTLYLATEEGLSVTEAKKQAESDVLKSFGIEGDFDAAEDLNIFGESDQSAALLAISILMQGDFSEGDFSERLAKFALDIETDGKWNDSKNSTKIADWANALWISSKLSRIRENITKWKLSAEVPTFEKYINNFWWTNYGLGTCDSKREGEVLKNQNEASVNANEYYICKSDVWNIAKDIEKDTYKWLIQSAKHTEEDGDVRYGDVVTTNCYVFENKKWRSGNANDCSLELRGCTVLRQYTVGKGSDKGWYICDSKSWRNATNTEMDTASWGAGSFDGEVRAGQINKSIYYIYKTSNKSWQNATTLEKDTYDFTNNKGWTAGVDGEIKQGSVTDSIYVYDKTAWRTANDVEKVLGGCVTATADSVGRVGSTFYICAPREWNIASTLQYDTYKKACSEDGSIIDGRINQKNKYVCDGGVFRTATEYDIRAGLGCTNYTEGEYKILSGQYSYYKCETDGWTYTTEKLNQGTMTDERDGQIYKTIGIKSQMWMTQNLNYIDSVNHLEQTWCYNNKSENCEKLGRLYSFSIAKSTDICPQGWHLPKLCEMHSLIQNTGTNDIYNFFKDDSGSFIHNTSNSCGEFSNCYITNDGEIIWNSPSKDKNECSLENNYFKPESYYWIQNDCRSDSTECDCLDKNDVLYSTNYYGEYLDLKPSMYFNYGFSYCHFDYGIYVRCVKD